MEHPAVVSRQDAEAQRDESVDYIEELSRLNNELVNAQRDLAKKNVELAALTRLKDQFLGIATHDLRRPLSAIQGYAELLQDELRSATPEELQGFIERILDSVAFMNRLVTDFLDVSMIESGHLLLEREPVLLSEIIAQVAALAEPAATNKSIRIVQTLDDDLPSLLLDRDRMVQAISNLLINAIEHSHAGSSVEIRARRDEHDMVLEVADTGVGIPEELQPLIFLEVKRRRTAKTGNEPSTGLGLVITRKIVEAHGGDVAVESEVDVGSTFRVRLPSGAELLRADAR